MTTLALPSRPPETIEPQLAADLRETKPTPYGFWGALILLATLYTFAKFSGMEWHPGYWGNVYQAIHPDSFPGDRYMNPSRPTLMSGYYLLVKAVGDLWLDDRFTMAIYFLLAIFALWMIDRTAQLLGANRISERFAILSLMILEHRFRDNLATLISHVEFNPTMLAGPFAALLLYYNLSGARLRTWVPAAAVVSFFSVKVAWVPILIGLVIMVKEQLTPRQRRWALGTAALASCAVLVFYYGWLRTPEANHPGVFDYIIRFMDNSEANPFLDTPLSNVLFVTLCAAGLLIRLPAPEVQRRVRSVSVIAFVLWLVGGLYLSFSPDFLKIPYVVPFDVNRGLYWPQYILFMGLAVWALKKHSEFPGSWVGATALLFILYLTHTGMKRQLFLGATAFALLAAYAVYWRLRQGEWTLTHDSVVWTRGIALAFFSTSVLFLGTMTLQRLPALRFLAKHGIMGDNPGAKWVGVNEYIRSHTPPTAVVFAMAMREYPWRPERLTFAGSLRSRTGRTMQFGHDVADHFNYSFLLWNRQHSLNVQAVVENWAAGSASGVLSGFRTIGSPDYIVAPQAKSSWVSSAVRFPYRPEATVDGYTIYKRTS